MAAVRCTQVNPMPALASSIGEFHAIRCLHPGPGGFGDHIKSSGNLHRTAWAETQSADAASWSQTVNYWNCVKPRNCHRHQPIFWDPFGSVWFVESAVGLFFPRLDPWFETFWVRTSRPRRSGLVSLVETEMAPSLRTWPADRAWPGPLLLKGKANSW